MLDTELERLLLYADLLVLWLDVGLGEREYVDDTDCVWMPQLIGSDIDRDVLVTDAVAEAGK